MAALRVQVVRADARAATRLGACGRRKGQHLLANDKGLPARSYTSHAPSTCNAQSARERGTDTGGRRSRVTRSRDTPTADTHCDAPRRRYAARRAHGDNAGVSHTPGPPRVRRWLRHQPRSPAWQSRCSACAQRRLTGRVTCGVQGTACAASTLTQRGCTLAAEPSHTGTLPVPRSRLSLSSCARSAH